VPSLTTCGPTSTNKSSALTTAHSFCRSPIVFTPCGALPFPPAPPRPPLHLPRMCHSHSRMSGQPAHSFCCILLLTPPSSRASSLPSYLLLLPLLPPRMTTTARPSLLKPSPSSPPLSVHSLPARRARAAPLSLPSLPPVFTAGPFLSTASRSSAAGNRSSLVPPCPPFHCFPLQPRRPVLLGV